jgi:hypothetical protein
VKTDPDLQARTVFEPSARCEGQNQFENFDRAFRRSLTVSKEAIFQEQALRNRARDRKRRRKK